MQYHDVDLTYGRFDMFVNETVESFTMPGEYPQSIIQSAKYRSNPWRACHLRVIKAEYLKRIQPNDFIDPNGDFIICSTDMVESFACLEQCNGRHKLCSEITMIYNKDNSMQFVETSHYSSVNKDKKALAQKNVRNIPSYKNRIQHTQIVVIDVNDPSYKTHLKTYRKIYRKNSDLLLYINDELKLYKQKLSLYASIIYLTESDNL